MPSRQKVEARYNVVTEYVNLGLHSAAANGNIGGVKYALQHGQPANSVLNGCLPIHAAASSGNDAIVRMLIDNGADVNAPRLSRRYERARSPGPAVGSSGSTPLHFAAANGHLDVVELLLSHGARPEAVEKTGLTPAAVAIQHEQYGVADLIQRWQDLNLGATSSTTDDDGGSTRPGRAFARLPSFSTISLHSLGHGGPTIRALTSMRSFDLSSARVATPTTPASSTLSRANSLSNLGHDGSSAGLSSFQQAPPSASALGLKGATHLQLSSPLMPQAPETAPPDLGTSVDKRRPSVSSVIEKVSHPGQALRSAFGFSGRDDQIPNGLGSSGTITSGSPMRKIRSKSSLTGLGSSGTITSGSPIRKIRSKSSLAVVFRSGRSRSDSADDEAAPERTRHRSATSPHGSITAPPLKTTFTTVETMAPTMAPTSPSSQVSFATPIASTSVATAAAKSFYRPRKSSQLSGRNRSGGEYDDESDDDLMEVTTLRRQREEPSLDSVRPAFSLQPNSPLPSVRSRTGVSSAFPRPYDLHRRTSSGGSSVSASVSGRSGFSSPPTSRRPTPADQEGKPPPLFGPSYCDRPLSNPDFEDDDRHGSDVAIVLDDDDARAEAADVFPSRGPRFTGHHRTGSRGRDRADSGSSAASASPAALPSTNWVPLAITGMEEVTSADSPVRSNWPSRSGSIDADGISSHLSASTAMTTTELETSALTFPASSSVSVRLSVPPPSPMLSTVCEAPALERTAAPLFATGHTNISAEEARDRVRRQKQELLNFDPSKGTSNGRKLSLSDSLAAYGESLSLVSAIEQKRMEAKGDKGDPEAPSFTWETISKNGSRVSVPVNGGHRRDDNDGTCSENRFGMAPVPLDQRLATTSAAKNKVLSITALSGKPNANEDTGASVITPQIQKCYRDHDSGMLTKLEAIASSRTKAMDVNRLTPRKGALTASSTSRSPSEGSRGGDGSTSSLFDHSSSSPILPPGGLSSPPLSQTSTNGGGHQPFQWSVSGILDRPGSDSSPISIPKAAVTTVVTEKRSRLGSIFSKGLRSR